MTRAMASPRRHEEILTHRTANRRLGEVECHQSDSCFDTEDNSNKQKGGGHYYMAGGSSAVALSPSLGGVGGTPQLQNRRRKKKPSKRLQLPQTAHTAIFLLTTFGCFFFFWQWNTSSHENTQPTISVAGGRNETSQKHFEQLSLTGSGSCSNPLSPADVSFTLVTQVSADRLWMMEHQCQRWGTNTTQYPISMAVFTNETTAQTQRLLKDLGCDMSRTTVQTLPTKLYPPNDYPVNKLRNLALQATKTSHAVLVDIDFWITQDLSQILEKEEVTDCLVEDPKATLVIPAFQLHRQCGWRECPEKNIPEMPYDFHDLKQQILDHKVNRFDPTNRGGHGSTKYKEWFKQNYRDGDTLLEIDCFLSNRYEPYLVFRLCWELPPFQEAFAGYGKNKMTWVMQLRRMGYSFWQLGKGAFVIHYPHLDSPSRVAWNNAPPKQHDKESRTQWLDYKRGRMDQLFVEFREWLRQEVPDRTRVPFCEDKLDDDARLWYDRKAFNATISKRSS